MSKIKCPICLKEFEPTAAEPMPFCSRRCQQVDLARWLGEGYSLPVEGHEDVETGTFDHEES